MTTSTEIAEIAAEVATSEVEAENAVTTAETAIIVAESAVALAEVVAADAIVQAAAEVAEVKNDVEQIEEAQTWTNEMMIALVARVSQIEAGLLTLTDQLALAISQLSTPAPTIVETATELPPIVPPSASEDAPLEAAPVKEVPEPPRQKRRRLM